MWDLLTRADIDRAERELAARREMLRRRQAEELAALDSTAADLEMLDKLARSFAAKFRVAPAPTKRVATEAARNASASALAVTRAAPAATRPASAVARAAPAVAKPAPAAAKPAMAEAKPFTETEKPVETPPPSRRSAERHHPVPAHAERRPVSGTNFEIFSRAVSKSAF